jgi:hypothetical protein
MQQPSVHVSPHGHSAVDVHVAPASQVFERQPGGSAPSMHISQVSGVQALPHSSMRDVHG